MRFCRRKSLGNKMGATWISSSFPNHWSSASFHKWISMGDVQFLAWNSCMEVLKLSLQFLYPWWLQRRILSLVSSLWLHPGQRRCPLSYRLIRWFVGRQSWTNLVKCTLPVICAPNAFACAFQLIFAIVACVHSFFILICSWSGIPFVAGGFNMWRNHAFKSFGTEAPKQQLPSSWPLTRRISDFGGTCFDLWSFNIRVELCILFGTYYESSPPWKMASAGIGYWPRRWVKIGGALTL